VVYNYFIMFFNSLKKLPFIRLAIKIYKLFLQFWNSTPNLYICTMIKRLAKKELDSLARQYKAVALTGPRQSGKTTLVRETFKGKPYQNLENPDTRRFALEDPRGFLSQYPEGAIIDEAQRAPELFSYMQQILDDDNKKGKFIITGSNNFLLQENITQSLAGRIGYLTLLPFSIYEIPKLSDYTIEELLYKGLYPPLYDSYFETDKWYSNYIRTYVERDVRLIKNISNLAVFEKFLKLCAARIGQLLNVNSLAVETGVDNKTITSWIGILESSFIAFRLLPHHNNYNKRVVKMPKLYFYDTGLACALLGIQEPANLINHAYRGPLFENFIIIELLKKRFNVAKNNNLFFWRDNTGHEIDIVLDKIHELYPIEIKSGKTITSDYFKGLEFWIKLTGKKTGAVIYTGDIKQNRTQGISVIPWMKMHEIESV